MTENEFKDMWAKRLGGVNADDFRYFVDRLGCRPSKLDALARNVIMTQGSASVKDFVDRNVLIARRELAQFPFPAIIAHLQSALAAGRTGVDPLVFGAEEEKGVMLSNPAKVFAVAKETNAVMLYRSGAIEEYRPISKAHEYALKNLIQLPQ